ncbi:MAG: hypothetical protein QF554_00830 [Dehalococcoidia bacterium]|jgi:hypothetical protein|nr:hypothetical protein [Dehalococcoidia bacterium]
MTVQSDLAGSTTGWAGSFAEDPNAVPVNIYLNGIRYPGEAVFTEFWNAKWGNPPGQEVMFRVVFLGSYGPVSSDDIGDDRIVVVAPSGDMSSELDPVAKEAAALRETRAGYAASDDPALSRLARAIEEREDELASKVAGSLGRRWASGAVIARGEDPDLTALLPTLERAGPDTWIEALGAWVVERGAEFELPRSTEPLTDSLLGEIFDLIVGRSVDPGPRASEAAAALGLGDGRTGAVSSQVNRLRSRFDELFNSDAGSGADSYGSVSGVAVRMLFTSTLRMPLELGALYLVDYARRRNAEAVLVPVTDAGFPEHVNRDTMPDMAWDPRLLQRLTVLHSVAGDDWNAALPYLSAVYPSARPSGDGDGPSEPGESGNQVSNHAAEAFMEELRLLESRVSLSAVTVARLERTLGAKSNWELDRLAGVLSADSWSELTFSAREAFGNAREFRIALARERTVRGLSIRSRDIEHIVTFLDAAEFGTEQRPLELEARALRARCGAGLLNEFAGIWPVLSTDFERWRTDSRRAYLSMHRTRRAHDEERQRKMARAIVQIAAIEGFAHLPELGPPQNRDLTQRYEELALGLEPCARLEHDLSLVSHPYCEGCGMTLSSPTERGDIDEFLFELESVLRSYNRRLSSVAIRETLAGRQPERLGRLLKLRDAADLSALSDHLGSDVIDFLHEFLAESDPQE